MEYYTVDDIMKMLRVSRTTAYKIAKDPRVPMVKVGRSIRVEKDRFDRLLRSGVSF